MPRTPESQVKAISDIGYPQVGSVLHLDAQASFDPIASQNQLTYRWDFGDGQQSTGITVAHAYTRAGQYVIVLTVSSSRGTRQVKKIVDIVKHPKTYPNQYRGRAPATNSPNPAVHLPTPNDSLHDRIIFTPGKSPTK